MNTKQLKILSIKAAIGISFIILILKLVSYFLTNSASVLATLMDSTLDIILSCINFFVIYHAHRPADDNHRYGHTKAEALGTLVQGAFILGFAILLIYEILNRAFNPVEIEIPPIAIGLLVISTLLVVALILFQRFVIKKTNSDIIKIDYLHYKMDFLLNIGVLLALLAAYYFQIYSVDLVFAFIVVVILLNGVRKILRSSLAILMDEELPSEIRAQIIKHVKSFKSCKGIHDMRTRSAGERIFIEFHMELASDLTLTQAHDITDEIEQSLKQQFKNAHILIHQEPEGIVDKRFYEDL